MQPSRLDLSVPRGDTLAFSFSTTVSGVALDMSSYSGKLQVRAAGSGDLLLEASTTGGEIATTTGGACSITVAAAKTALLPVGTHEWALQFSSPSIAVDTWLEGKYTCTPDKVRST